MLSRFVARAALASSNLRISSGVQTWCSRLGAVGLSSAVSTLSTFYQTRYDALAHEFLERTGGLRLSSQCQCWLADVLVADQSNPQQTSVRFQITLVGLGSIGRTR